MFSRGFQENSANDYFLFLVLFLAILKMKKSHTAQKMKFSIKSFFSKYDQIRRKLRIWSLLLKKSFMKNFNFCAVLVKKVPLFDLIEPAKTEQISFQAKIFQLASQL